MFETENLKWGPASDSSEKSKLEFDSWQGLAFVKYSPVSRQSCLSADNIDLELVAIWQS